MKERERIKDEKAEISLPDEPVQNGLILDGKTYEFAETGDNDFHCDKCALRERCDAIFPCSVCEPFSIYGYFRGLEPSEAGERV